jgi:hypothetical protein
MAYKPNGDSRMTVNYIDINGETREASSLSIPADRFFRNAWKFKGDAIEVDMTAARDIHRDSLRAERKLLLETLDVEYMKALEQGGDTAAIAARKQILRDVTADPRIEAAATPDELKALTLDALIA